MDCWVVLITESINTVDSWSCTSNFCIYHCRFQSFLCIQITW